MNRVIQKYLASEENNKLDFKQTVSNASKIAKTMVSFANTNGGVLLIGVRDNKTISGVKSEDEKYMLDMAAHFYCRPELNILIIEHEADGKTVLEVQIPEGSEKPYYSKGEDGKWWVYVRVNDKSLLASKTTVDFLHSKSNPEGAGISMGRLETDILKFIAAREKTTLYDIAKSFNIGKRRASRIIVNLMSLGVVRSIATEKIEFYVAM